MDMVNMWDMCMSHELFGLVDEGDYAKFLQKASVGTLVREQNSYRKYDSSFISAFTKKDYKNSDELYKAVYRKVASLLVQCEVSEHGINMDAVLKYVAPELAKQIVFGNPSRLQDKMLQIRCKSQRNITVQLSGNIAYAGCLDKKVRHSDDTPYRCRYFRSMRSERVYQIDLIRFFSELIIISECYRYYDNVLKNMTIAERLDNTIFYKACQFDRIFEKGVAVAPDDANYQEISELMTLLGVRCIPGRDSSQDYATFAYLNGTNNHVVIHHNNICRALNVFYEIYGEERILKHRESYLAGVAADYASSYQPLKNMPQKYVDAANQSLFSRLFGTVEYDYDTDLDKMKELGKEFMAVMQMFGMPDLGEYSLRFRKLGHHKASGLYYPSLQCMCVDIRIPSSFTHEFFHLCDFAAGELSLKARFLNVRQTYERIVRDEVANMPDGCLKKQLEGKSKYNLKYYLEPTEIFARMGELYMSQVLGVRNSLIEQSYKGRFEYPSNPELLGYVKDYFDYFFSEVIGIAVKKNAAGM